MSGAGSSDRIMNLKRLQYFVKIVDIGNLTQAADILHVAQPALSQQLATLGVRSPPTAPGSHAAGRDADGGRQGPVSPRSAHSSAMRSGAG